MSAITLCSLSLLVQTTINSPSSLQEAFQSTRVRLSAHGDQHILCTKALLTLWRTGRDPLLRTLVGDGLYFGLRDNGDAALAERTDQLSTDLVIHRRENGGQHFDNRYL